MENYDLEQDEVVLYKGNVSLKLIARNVNTGLSVQVFIF